jgi:uncharacterized protein (DUF362 family)
LVKEIRRFNSILVKPNFCHPKTADSGSVTHPQTIKGVLEFLLDLDVPKILIGDGIAQTKKHRYRSTMLAYESAGLMELLKEYSTVKLVDLYLEEKEKVNLALGTHFSSVGIARSASQSGIINLAKLKGHHRVGVTGAMKNLMGCIADKNMFHGDNEGPFLAENITDLYLTLKESIIYNIVDGIIGMLDRPYDGTRHSFGVILGSTSAPALDEKLAKILGVPTPKYVLDALSLEKMRSR